MATIIERFEVNIPEYAMSYLINGDMTGVDNQEDIDNMVKWETDMNVYAQSQGCTWHIDYGNYETGFYHYPEFGLATTCVECQIILMK